MSTDLLIGLSAVMVAAENHTPYVLCTKREGLSALPFGAFDPDRHRTFELALRGWVREQTGFDIGYVEQLYTFGDKDRETPEATLADAPKDARVISVGYLTLTPTRETPEAGFEAVWRSWFDFFPWEDHRNGRPRIIDESIGPKLLTWAAGNEARLERARLAFSLDNDAWVEERVLERYELLYEAGLVEECARDSGLSCSQFDLGQAMASDHRRILATAIARLRGKIKYRPIVFELMPRQFTLSNLQHVVEAVLGLTLHKQNFRRALDRAGLVEGLGVTEDSTGGRPAELYRFKRELLRLKSASGVATPTQRRD